MNKVIEDIKLDFEDVLIYLFPINILQEKSVDIKIDWLDQHITVKIC